MNRKQYIKLYERIEDGAIGPDFRDKMRLGRFARVKHLCRIIKNYGKGFERGLDFGCAHGGMTVWGKSVGLDITGVDIPGSHYQEMQKNLISMDYPVVHFDTYDTKEWTQRFRENQFDFVLFASSLTMGCESDSPYMLNQLKETETTPRLLYKRTLNQRIVDIARIIRPDGVWLVRPNKDLRILTQNKVFRKLRKAKKFKVSNTRG